ncbi:MAG: anthranilate synthase component I family protein, partial [Candidatus Zixiibacteriota bacterium]
LKQEIIIIANILVETDKKLDKRQYNDALNWIMKTKKELTKPVGKKSTLLKTTSTAKVVANTSQADFENMVRRAKHYIREGDVYQVVLSQRWQINSPKPALDVYRRLRRINPSPYMFLLNFGSDAVVGASPEMMVRIEKGIIETRPIAGTRARGKNDEEDQRLIEDLFSDKKELSEHTMLLDLGRNDIGRVSKTGSVQVKENMNVEKYSHVIHIVSSVVGEMNGQYQPIDGHFACFPAGTVSGAPKIRAMEIIDELEKERRGVYAGSIAYLDFWGNFDSCIAIRTLVKKGKTYYIQAGAGIVADSDPTREYDETKAKAFAAIQAVTEVN